VARAPTRECAYTCDRADDGPRGSDVLLDDCGRVAVIRPVDFKEQAVLRTGAGTTAVGHKRGKGTPPGWIASHGGVDPAPAGPCRVALLCPRFRG
jgi:hypothetical protein